MPGIDGTGPKGMGSRSGRGFGPCGRCFGRRFFSPKNELEALEEEEKILERELEAIKAEKEALRDKK